MKAHEKYYIEACKAFGKTPIPTLKDRSDSDVVSADAYARLITCVAFKNMIKDKRWIPNYNGSETHYFVRIWPNASGSGFSGAVAGSGISISSVGARLEYRTWELCEEGLKLLKLYYIDYMILLKSEDIK